MSEKDLDEARVPPGEHASAHREPGPRAKRDRDGKPWYKKTGPGHRGRIARVGAKDRITEEPEQPEPEDVSVIEAPEVATHAHDILQAVAMSRPADAQQAFKDLLADRIADFVATRREEMAGEVWGQTPEKDEFGTDDEILDEPAEEEQPTEGEHAGDEEASQ